MKNNMIAKISVSFVLCIAMVMALGCTGILSPAAYAQGTDNTFIDEDIYGDVYEEDDYEEDDTEESCEDVYLSACGMEALSSASGSEAVPSASASETIPGASESETPSKASGSEIKLTGCALLMENEGDVLFSPVIREKDTWYEGNTPKSEITAIQFEKEASPSQYIECWDASADGYKGVMAYIESTEKGKTLWIVGNNNKIILPDNAHNMLRGFNNVVSITGTGNLDVSECSDFSCMFAMDEALTDIDLSSWDVATAKDFGYMFYGCAKLKNVKLPEGRTSGALESMRSMFYNCSSLQKADLNGLNTSEVKSMRNLFYGCNSLKSPDTCISIDTGKVTDMAGMFYNCSSLEYLDLAAFDTGSVQDMSYMFAGIGVDSLNLSNFDTSSVTSMKCMFMNMKAKELNLQGFNIKKLEDASFMFYNCANLEKICDKDNFDTSSIKKDTNMFAKCYKLRGERNTCYTTKHAGKLYARLDQSLRCGYFSKFDD